MGIEREYSKIIFIFFNITAFTVIQGFLKYLGESGLIFRQTIKEGYLKRSESLILFLDTFGFYYVVPE